VRTYHHGDLMAKTVTGTAEGVVNGKRQSMALDIRPGSQAGMYVVRWQRPAVGRWVLVINSGMQGVTDATAVVDISPSGGVASVTVPTPQLEMDGSRHGRWRQPRSMDCYRGGRWPALVCSTTRTASVEKTGRPDDPSGLPLLSSASDPALCAFATVL